jgi:acetyl esterase/lipase
MMMAASVTNVFSQEKIYLYPGDKDTAQAFLLIYKVERNENINPSAVLIIPGGGYTHVAMDHEGIDVAKWLNSMGMDAYVLRYRVTSNEGIHHYPDQLNDIKAAMEIVRKTKYKSIGVMGFSAGGHLAGTYLTEKKQHADFGILMYPVITGDSTYRHNGSFKALTGDTVLKADYPQYSINKRVTKKTPPLWLLHTKDDKVVPYQNSTLLYDAAKPFQPKTQLTLFDKGGHGFGMHTLPNETEQWKPLCASWIKERCQQ